MGKVKPSKTAKARGATWSRLNRLCRQLVVEVRDGNRCQRCPIPRSDVQIHWAHVITRGAKSAQWVEWNSLALCAGCHFWFDGHREKGLKWWSAKFPEREVLRLAWKAQRSRPKINYDLIQRYLEQRLNAA